MGAGMIGTVLLMILKCLIALLLCTLLIFAVLSILVLFVPIRYKARISRTSRFIIDIKATWLLKMFKLFYSNNIGSGRFKLVIFNKIQLGAKPKRNKKRKRKSGSSKKKKTHKGRKGKSLPGNKGISAWIRSSRNKQDKLGKLDKKSKAKESEAPAEDGSMLGKLRSIILHPDRGRLFKEARKLTGGLLSAMKPGKLKIDAVIGFDDPYITGRLIGALAFFTGIAGVDMRVRGSFDGPALNGDIDIEGRIVLWRFVWPVVRFVLARPVWRIIKPIIFGRNIDEKS